MDNRLSPIVPRRPPENSAVLHLVFLVVLHHHHRGNDHHAGLGAGRAGDLGLRRRRKVQWRARSALGGRPDAALTSVARLLAGADLAVVNLETAVTERGIRAPKQFAFRAPATALDALRGAGVDVAGQQPRPRLRAREHR